MLFICIYTCIITQMSFPLKYTSNNNNNNNSNNNIIYDES